MDASFAFDRAETIARLESSLETVAAFVSRVPARFTHDLPPGWPDDAWTVAMNLAHMVAYEESLASPVLEDLAAGGDGSTNVTSGGEAWLLDAATAIAPLSVAALVTRLQAARARQIAVVRTMPEARLNAPLCMLFASRSGGVPHPPSWVAMKTFQHTWEHGNAILRVALFTPR